MRAKCSEKIYVGLWGQSTVSMGGHQQSGELGCYKWHQNNYATVANHMFSAPNGGKDLETKVQ